MNHLRRIIPCVLAFVLLGAASPAQAAQPADDANLSAGWLARTLAENNDVALLPAGGVDYASTAYALVGLRAAGVAGDQVAASARAMAASGDAFIGAPDQADSKATAISLMILAMVAGGLDPSQYAGSAGTRDLYADLGALIQADGAVSSGAKAYGQSFAILALLSAPSGVPSAVTGWLLDQPCTDSTSVGYGGYGFSGPGSCDDVDPDSTAMAVIALIDAGTPVMLLEPARSYLVSVQDSSGGFASPYAGINANTTGLAVAALNAISQAAGTMTTASPSLSSDAEVVLGVGYLESLMYDCDAGSDVAGAMALTSDARSATQIDPLAPLDQTVFFQATAQGIYGFVDKVTNPEMYGTMSPAEPESMCPVPETTASSPVSPVPADSTTAANNWLWAIGGCLVVILVYIGWRLIISVRR